jgi:Predicted nucleotide-binding protein containing TIR-like domain
MARKRDAETTAPDPELTVPREEAEHKIADRLTKGQALLQRDFRTVEDIDKAKDDYSKWSSYNNELLTRLFTTPKLATEYSWWGAGVMRTYPPSPAEQLDDLKKDTAEKLRRLESIKERLELIPLAAGVRPVPPPKARAHTNRVFIVHGHDEAARETVARFLERLGIEAIILHEQATGGRTLIEKLEHYSDVDFAVVLMTPDDLGRAKRAHHLATASPPERHTGIGFLCGEVRAKSRLRPLSGSTGAAHRLRRSRLCFAG